MLRQRVPHAARGPRDCQRRPKFTLLVYKASIDITRATGQPMHLTADHDGVLVGDLVAKWASRHQQPYTLHLIGPAGGSWSLGTDGPRLELDAVEFCRTLSGREHGDGLLAISVPF